MAIKYVQNVSPGVIWCKFRAPEEQGGMVKNFIFTIKKFDKLQGKQEHSGYTAIDEKDLEYLKEHNHVFKFHHFKQKDLIIHDKLPAHAQTPAQIMADLTAENAKLKARIRELEELLDADDVEIKKSKKVEDSVKDDVVEEVKDSFEDDDIEEGTDGDTGTDE